MIEGSGRASLERKNGMNKTMQESKLARYLYLQISVFILAVSAAFHKAAADMWGNEGEIHLPVILCIAAYLVLMLVYAVMWQRNLEQFELGFLYTNRCLCTIWAQIIAVVVFKNKIYALNVIGLLLIFWGVWINSKDV